METHGNGGLVHQRDFIHLEHLERVKSFDNLELDCFPCNPRLVFLSVHAAPFDEMQANVDDVDVVHLVAGTAGIGGAGEEAKDEGIKAISGVLIGSHALPVCLTILGGCLAILFDEPEEKVDKYDVWFAEAALLEGGMHLHRHCFKEYVGKGGVYCYNVGPCLFSARVRCPDRGAVVLVRASGEVGYIGSLGWEGRKGIGVSL